MRKIVSKKEESKKGKTKQIVVGILLVFIMILSTIGYSLNNLGEEDSKRIFYEGIEFVKEDSFWSTKIGDFNFLFSYNPTETERIYSEMKYINEYSNLPLYIYSENSGATREIYRNLFYYNRLVERIQEACSVGEKCGSEIPIKNCSNNFIIIKISEEKEIRQEEKCVFISGKEEELVKITDEFLFKIMGIQ